ncbi:MULTISPECIES: hypothetical protein [unclassified Sphingomonas]|uniref:hypothetical protein n=1 Tax=unclassified Sphingomonas TaxID=196159 RepID=UPI00092607E0|nr:MULTISPECIES: hypothetical protein [unclassified Sphingomonas]MBN8847751.1 hypothetical protein [Sphingomonas sp.]OJV33742.1 MAG: hypothetical protein BGO24_09810 [Sphingomonas sp. 67-36]
MARDRLVLLIACLLPQLSGCQQSGMAPQKESERKEARAIMPNRAAHMLSCARAIRGLNVQEAVKRDIAQGETRFFFWNAQEGMMWVAPGIKRCATFEWDKIRLDEIGGFERPELSASPEESLCAALLSNFEIDYNRAMAAAIPASLQTNCEGRRARIDASYPKEDIDAYEARISGK